MRKTSKRVFSIFIALAIFMMPMMASVIPVLAAADTKITIIHTNDMHGSVEDLAYVKDMKSKLENPILVDAGDAAQGSALATYTEGVGVIELMNTAGYDGMTFGNHEFDYGSAAAVKIASAANFPVVSANIFNKDGNLLLKDSTNASNGKYFIKEIAGKKIGFFGITTTETAYKTNPSKLDGTTFRSEIEYSKAQVQALKAEGADVVVGLVHVGIDATSDPISYDIAKQVPGIDLLIDGHSHSVDNTKIDNTLVVQTGTKLANVGVVELEFTGNVVTFNAKPVANPSKDSPLKATYIKNQEYADLYEEKTKDLDKILGVKVSKSDTTVFTFDAVDGNKRQVSRLEETPGGSLVADAMLEEGGRILNELGYKYPVVALQNGGGCRENILAGDITLKSVLSVLPFGNMISIKEVTPDVLYEALENGYQAIEVTAEGYLNLSNALGAYSQIAGMRAVVDADQAVGERVKEIYLVDEKTNTEVLLDRSDSSTIIALASNDFEIAGGDGYTMLSNLKHIAEGGALDVVLQNYITNHTVNDVFTYAKTHGRVKVKQIEAIQNTGYVDIIPNITLTPNTNYNVTIDGITTVARTTNENGNFVLEKVTNGVHTISVDGADYYTSTYTNINVLNMEVVAAPVIIPEVPTTEVPTTQAPNVSKPATTTQTGDETAILGFIFMSAISGGYLAMQKRKYN